MYRLLSTLLVLSFGSVYIGGCAAAMIPNTSVEDTSDNRQVVEFVEDYRRAVEARDMSRLMAMASERYYDDAGTPVGTDDVDFDSLSERLALWAERLQDCRYEIRYRSVEFGDDQKIRVTYRYTGSFRILDAEGEARWERRVGDNELVLTYDAETEEFHILSGM